MSGGLAITPVGPADGEDLAAFFALVAARPDVTARFHPHPFTPEQAARLAGLPRRDRYHLARYAGRVAGYAMLRGWDEGFDVPSFGFCVHPGATGAGVGRALLAHAVAEARAAGAARLRATVDVDNGPSRRVLEAAGFAFAPRDARTLVGFVALDAARVDPRPVDLARLAAWARAAG